MLSEKQTPLRKVHTSEMKTAILVSLIVVLAGANVVTYLGARAAIDDRQARIGELSGKLAAADAQLAGYRAEREQLRYQAASAGAALKLCQEMHAGSTAEPPAVVTLESVAPEAARQQAAQKEQEEATATILRALVKLLF